MTAPTPTSYVADPDVALAAAGDRRAFERLYRQNVTRVFSLCVRMVSDRTRAEELTQDVFVRAWEKLHLFRGEAAFGTWLHRMTVNVVLNARKTEGRQRSRFDDDDEGDGIESLPAVGERAGRTRRDREAQALAEIAGAPARRVEHHLPYGIRFRRRQAEIHGRIAGVA